MKKIILLWRQFNSFWQGNYFGVIGLLFLGMVVFVAKNWYYDVARPYVAGPSLLKNNTYSLDSPSHNFSVSAQKTASSGKYLSRLSNIKAVQAQSDDRKVIKNGNLTLKVDNPKVSVKHIKEELSKHESQISNISSYELRPGVFAYRLQIRILASSFDEIFELLRGFGEERNISTNSSDVTDAYEDIENQLNNDRLHREKLRQLLSRQNSSVEEILKVNNELNRVQKEIERKESRIKRYDKDISYSVIHLTLNPEISIGDEVHPDWNLGYSWKTAINQFLSAGQKIVDFALLVIVYGVVWVPVFIGIWYFRKKLKK